MVSVIIPSYNRRTRLKYSIESVLEQTYKDIELIIVDDGSADGTPDMVAGLNDSRIVLVQQNHLGACAARNNGIEHATGEFIAFHDSDDLCRIDRIEKQLEIIEKENSDLIIGNICIHYPNGETRISPGRKFGTVTKISELYGYGTMTFFGRRRVFENTKFDDEMPRWQDLEELLRIFQNYKIYVSSNIFIDNYEQADSISQNSEKGLKAYDLIIQKHPEIIKDNELYQTLIKHKVSFKLDLGIKYVSEELTKVYKLKPNIKNFGWMLSSKLGLAGTYYEIGKKAAKRFNSKSK